MGVAIVGVSLFFVGVIFGAIATGSAGILSSETQDSLDTWGCVLLLTGFFYFLYRF